MTTIKAKTQSIKGMLQNLRSNTAGNTFAMAAAALFPIAGVIGGGVDIGRAYMAKARLQQACDAGALAGRRSMTSDTFTAADQAQARGLFDFNFPEGSFGTENFQQINGVDNPRFESLPDSERAVDGYAETTIPTTIMKIFDKQTMTVKVSCTSRLDVGNVDVMMVLDVTGSMAQSVSGGGTRLEALQDAVEEFYNILGPGGGAAGNQIRYGFVPYTSSVNVGKILYDKDPTWLIGGTAGDRWTYQTRRSTWETSTPDLGDPKTSNDVVTFETWNSLDGPECVDRFGENLNIPGWFNPNPSGNPLSSTEIVGSETIITTITYEYDAWDANDNSSFEAGETALPPPGAVGSAFWNRCQRMVTTNTSTYDTPVPTTVDVWEPGATNFAGWTYGQFTHDVSGYVASIDTGVGVQRPTVNGANDYTGANATRDIWPGCIEERDTNATITSSTTSIPADALDMQINLLPTDAASRWRPHWKEIVYDPDRTVDGWWVTDVDDPIKDNNGYAPCPTESRILAEYAAYDDGTATDLESYITGLTANGGTNHTIGMIWGARLLSDEGLFATENSFSSNGFQIGRHLLFMTDGTIDIRKQNYGSYNVNEFFGKIGPTSSEELELEARQAQRFQLMCAAARANGYTVWVVQFGVSTVTSNMENCATSADHAKPATDAASLEAAFSDIAQTIGGLRLSQ